MNFSTTYKYLIEHIMSHYMSIILDGRQVIFEECGQTFPCNFHYQTFCLIRFNFLIDFIKISPYIPTHLKILSIKQIKDDRNKY